METVEVVEEAPPVRAFEDPGPPEMGVAAQSAMLNPLCYLQFALCFLCWKPDVACSPYPGSRPPMGKSLLKTLIFPTLYGVVGSLLLVTYCSYLEDKYGEDEMVKVIVEHWQNLWRDLRLFFLVVFWCPLFPLPFTSPLEVFLVNFGWERECCFAWRISGRCCDPLVIFGCKVVDPDEEHEKYQTQLAVQNAVNSGRCGATRQR